VNRFSGIIVSRSRVAKGIAIKSIYMLSVALALVACSKGTFRPSQMSDPKYKDWVIANAPGVRIFHPPKYPEGWDFDRIAQMYSRGSKAIGQTLAIDSMPDTITVFYYTGPGQGMELTKQGRPFADSEAVYYWPAYAPGPSLTKFLLQRWSKVEPTANKFVWHGLLAFFDFAKENYHRTTLDYTKDTLFIPLEKLAVDTTINSDVERYQSAEAASFVAFVIAQYSPEVLKQVYESTEPLAALSPTLFGKPIDSLAQEWRAYFEAVVNSPIQKE